MSQEALAAEEEVIRILLPLALVAHPEVIKLVIKIRLLN